MEEVRFNDLGLDDDRVGDAWMEEVGVHDLRMEKACLVELSHAEVRVTYLFT